MAGRKWEVAAACPDVAAAPDWLLKVRGGRCCRRFGNNPEALRGGGALPAAARARALGLRAGPSPLEGPGPGGRRLGESGVPVGEPLPILRGRGEGGFRIGVPLVGLRSGGLWRRVSFPLGRGIRFGTTLALLPGAASPWGLWLGDPLLFFRGEGRGEAVLGRTGRPGGLLCSPLQGEGCGSCGGL